MDRKVSVSLRLLQKRHGDFYALEVAKKIGADGLDFSFSKEDYRKPDSIYSKPQSEFAAHYGAIRAKAEDQSFLIACVDTGHTNKSVGYDGNPSVGDTIRRLGERVACLHMHDNNGISDQHRAPFSGNIDWVDVFDALDEIGYTGWYNLEPNLNLLKSFGKGFEVEYAAFAVKILRFMLESRYGKE